MLSTNTSIFRLYVINIQDRNISRRRLSSQQSRLSTISSAKCIKPTSTTTLICSRCSQAGLIDHTTNTTFDCRTYQGEYDNLLYLFAFHYNQIHQHIEVKKRKRAELAATAESMHPLPNSPNGFLLVICVTRITHYCLIYSSSLCKT